MATPAKDSVSSRGRDVIDLVSELGSFISGPSSWPVVLTFHRVGYPASEIAGEMNISEKMFARQMATLAELFDTVTVSDLTQTDPRRSLAITVDDGSADLHSRILPVLDDNGLSATAYIATNFVESGLPFPDGAPALNWTQLEEMAASGRFEIGSHTHNHAVLGNLAPDAVAKELQESKSLLEDKLQLPVKSFCYPKGVRGSSDGEAIVRSMFETAVIGGRQLRSDKVMDPHRIPRQPVLASDDIERFLRKIHGGATLEPLLRQVYDRFRYRRACY
jgi:peptidoglycan/xylan/chitin deacetylase (PgdA/CDA1 family)